MPNRNGDKHVSETATLALDLLHMTKNLAYPTGINRPVNIRVGIHTGRLKLLLEDIS